MKKVLFIIIFILPLIAQATIYKSIDDQGNIYFSDKPSENVEEIALSDVQNYSSQDIQQQSTNNSCCKVCRTGKACGDSCIARSKTCTKPRGCACNA